MEPASNEKICSITQQWAPPLNRSSTTSGWPVCSRSITWTDGSLEVVERGPQKRVPQILDATAWSYKTLPDWAMLSRWPLNLGYVPLNVNVAVTLPPWAVWVAASATGAAAKQPATAKAIARDRIHAILRAGAVEGNRSPVSRSWMESTHPPPPAFLHAPHGSRLTGDLFPSTAPARRMAWMRSLDRKS